MNHQRDHRRVKLLSKRINGVLGAAEAVLVALAMAAVFAAMCLITANALGRHLFSFPIKGSEVVVGLFLAPIITYLALSSALAKRDHVAVTLLVTRMGPRLRRFSQIFAALIVAGSFGLLAYEGWL